MENYNANLALVHSEGADAIAPKIGLIHTVNQSGHTARLSFSDLSSKDYPLTEVLLLKEKGRLYKELLSATASINVTDFKVLLRVNMLQEKGSPGALIEAMELLSKNPSALALATERLSERLSQSKLAAMGLDIGNGRVGR